MLWYFKQNIHHTYPSLGFVRLLMLLVITKKWLSITVTLWKKRTLEHSVRVFSPSSSQNEMFFIIWMVKDRYSPRWCKRQWLRTRGSRELCGSTCYFGFNSCQKQTSLKCGRSNYPVVTEANWPLSQQYWSWHMYRLRKGNRILCFFFFSVMTVQRNRLLNGY